MKVSTVHNFAMIRLILYGPWDPEEHKKYLPGYLPQQKQMQ
jgi:hypothetical protein